MKMFLGFVLKWIILLLNIFCSGKIVKIQKETDVVEDYVDKDDYPTESLIDWKNLLNEKEDTYFVYVFSYTCHYCNSLKSDFLSFYSRSDLKIYLVEYEDSIPLSYNIADTLGMDKLSEIFIKGTPTLLLIEDKKVALNVAGINDIKNLISIY